MARFFSKMTTKEPSVFVCVCVRACEVCVRSVAVMFNYLRLKCRQKVIGCDHFFFVLSSDISRYKYWRMKYFAVKSVYVFIAQRYSVCFKIERKKIFEGEESTAVWCVHKRASLNQVTKYLLISAELNKNFFAANKYVSQLCYVSMCDGWTVSVIFQTELWRDVLKYHCM
jgi:hypothetical protein